MWGVSVSGEWVYIFLKEGHRVNSKVGVFSVESTLRLGGSVSGLGLVFV